MSHSVIRRLGLTSGFLVFSAIASGTAFADAIQVGVVPTSPKVPVMTQNGDGYTPGTYAIGTIQLDYTVVGMSFPAGDLATFRLDLNDIPSSGGAVGYPTLLSIYQNGVAPNVRLTPSNSPLSVTGLGWASSVDVTVSIPASVATDPSLDDDGDEIVGQLQLKADDSKLKTVPTVIVRIKLVHPTACLKVYDFITDASLVNTITSTTINVNGQGKVTATNPYGSLSQNVMIVNTCAAAESFDLRVTLDAWFSTQPSNNPGNAVFTFSTAGEIDASTFNIASFGIGTPQGQKLCLENVSVPGDSTYLATVHMSIKNGSLASGLPASGIFTGFGAALTVAGASCGGTSHAGAAPNPISAPLSFSIR